MSKPTTEAKPTETKPQITECETGRLLLRWGVERGTMPPQSVVWLYESYQQPIRYMGAVRESEAEARHPWAQRARNVLERLANHDPRREDQGLRLDVDAQTILAMAEVDRVGKAGWLFHDPEGREPSPVEG